MLRCSDCLWWEWWVMCMTWLSTVQFAEYSLLQLSTRRLSAKSSQVHVITSVSISAQENEGNFTLFTCTSTEVHDPLICMHLFGSVYGQMMSICSALYMPLYTTPNSSGSILRKASDYILLHWWMLVCTLPPCLLYDAAVPTTLKQMLTNFTLVLIASTVESASIVSVVANKPT